jgi:hypothetical protein
LPDAAGELGPGIYPGGKNKELRDRYEAAAACGPRTIDILNRFAGVSMDPKYTASKRTIS